MKLKRYFMGGDKNMKYFSLFSGIGGFELAMPKDWECVGYSEINKHAIKVYESHFKHKNYGDITNINAEELPGFDLICGGFPCQPFSIAGKRGGFDDTRGTLFFDIARIVEVKRPSLLFLENVKGLLSHDRNRTFDTIIRTLDQLGYDLQWQVLNSKNFGVPQNRQRVFIIGHLRGTSRPEVFPIGITKEIHSQSRKSKERLYDHSQTITTQSGRNGTGSYIASTLTARQFSSWNGNYINQVIPVLSPDRIKKRQNGRRFKQNGDPSFTLTAQDRHGIYDGLNIRRLTPIECERLQGFPDKWTESISEAQRYKCLGNAVTVNVVKYITNLLTAQK